MSEPTAKTIVAPAVADYGAWCAQARALLDQNQPDEAAAAARRALALLPRGLEAQRLLGLALLAKGEARAAMGALQAAIDADPRDVVAQVALAEAREAIGGAADAEPAWLRAWELDPGNPAIEERLQAARRAAGTLAGEPAALPLTRAALARIYLRGGLFEHAAAEARALLRQDPARADLHLLLAEALWRMGDAEGAQEVASSMLERWPDCVAANLLVAAHWQALGQDPTHLLARARAVDPEGRIAARLFDDRPAPLPVDSVPAAQAPAPELGLAVPPPAAPAAAEPEAGVAAEPAHPAGPVEAPHAAEPAGAIEPAEAPRDAGAAPVEVQPEQPAPVPAEIEGEPAVQPAGSAAPLAEAPEAIAPAVPAAAETVTAPAPRGEEAPTVAQAMQAGDEAMRARRYLDAMRAYGQALRLLRTSVAGTQAGQARSGAP